MTKLRVWGSAALLVAVLACNSPPDDGDVGGGIVTRHDAVIDPSTPIGGRYVQLGGAAVLGQDITSILVAPNGDEYVRFEKGVIVYSVSWGAVLLSTPLFDKWLSLNTLQTSQGKDVFTYIGSPKQDYTVTANVETGYFERGIVIAPPSPGTAYAVYGPIYEQYHGVAAKLGLPKSEEGPAPNGGRVQAFENGDIYWSWSTGAHAIQGAIRARWLALGGATSTLGYPESDEVPVLRNGTQVGSAIKFFGGKIYSGATGTWDVTGEILTAYEGQYAGAAGWLGLPVGSTSQTAAGTKYTDFEGGILVRVPSRPEVWAFNTLQLYWQRMQGYGDDCWGCGSQDIYVNVWMTTPFGSTQSRFPGSDDCGGGCDINQNWPLTQVVHHDFFVDLQIEGKDHDGWFNKDDLLGWVHVRYDVDNLFGMFDGGPHRGQDDDRAFEINFGTQHPIPYDTTDWVKNLGWKFENFSTPSLSYDQFASTFSDVSPEESWWRHPFNRAYYDLVYEELADGGNCFGMSLTSVYAQKNELIWAEPIYRFPQSDAITNEVNIKHGFQVGGRAISWFVEQFGLGATHDPKRVFELSEAAYDRGDYPVIAMTSEYFGGSGHAVRPYKWERSQTLWKMWIYDNNYPGSSVFIAIDPSKNTFSYDGYQGGAWTGGRMFYYPFRVLHGTPHTPFWEVASLISDSVFVLLGSTGQTHQITDEQGRSFYEPSLTAPPTRWDELRQDEANRVPEFARLALSDGPAVSRVPFEMYYGKAAGKSYQYLVGAARHVAAGTPYEWTLNSGTFSAHLSVPATPNAPDLITAKHLGTSDKSIGIKLPPNGVEKRVTLTVAGGVKQRWAEIKNVKLLPSQSFAVKLSNGGYGLHFENDGPTTTGELTVQSSAEGNPVVVGTITIPGGGESTFEFARPSTQLTHTGGVPGNDGWFLSPLTITLDATDYSGKGIDYVEYKVDDGAWTRYTSPFQYAHQGVTTLSYRAKDKHGNQEATKTEQFKIDSRAPVLTTWVDRPTYTRTEPFVVHFSAQDPVPGSGLASLVGLLDGKPVNDGQVIDLLWMDLGVHTLSVTARDIAGGVTQRTVTFEIVATLGSLRELVLELLRRGEIDNPGIAQSLLAKIDETADIQRQAGKSPTVNRLRALAHHVSAQSGKHITERAAELLARDIEYLVQQLK